MNRTKSLMLSTTLAMLITSPLYATSSLTSAEIGTLATVAAIDKNEILVSVVATNKKTDAGVADFAKMMIDQHGSNLTQILEMAHNLHASSLAGSEAESISAQGKKDIMTLGALQGSEFDRAYVNAMVKGHQGALDLINNKLMKTAKSEEMKKFLSDTKAAVEHHLEDAKKLQEDKA
jgi:putative membrane protein